MNNSCAPFMAGVIASDCNRRANTFFISSISSARRRSARVPMKAYHEQTEPLVDFYRTRGKLAEIKFCPSIEETTAEVMKALEA